MSDRDDGQVVLSAAGRRRRMEIERALIERARNRRRGAAVLGVGMAGVLAVCAAIGVRGILSPSAGVYTAASKNRPAQREVVGHASPNLAPEPSPLAAPAQTHETRPEVRVTIVTNDPIPDRPCPQSETASTSSPSSGGPPICVLSDSQLLSVLAQTGKSYGLVRVGGKAHVVLNSASE